ncbi:unannotated protein [freshwater metagenome]|uniref:Unannotated protein n=1 Tax=freshwater metagenome TaxID=449393 RepID=A0A6J7DMX7_9ZZZZ|nr:YifB family Mg chelatase-like AAA ATPase [Actinomycetota bacterium]
MSIGQTHGVVLVGVDGVLVNVEVDLADGVVGTAIVGLADRGINEAKDRVRSALVNSGHRWPAKRVTISLSPAWIPKVGAVTDLAIALAMLVADGVIPGSCIENTVVLGELGLDGQVRQVRGVLPAVLAAHRAGIKRVMVPIDNCVEASLVTDVEVIGVSTLAHACAILTDQQRPPTVHPVPTGSREFARRGDLTEVVGQQLGKRALEVAAAGGHHLFFHGPPGAGKTMLAERLPSIMPALSAQAALEITAIRSLVEDLDPNSPLVSHPPFEAPHHTMTLAAMVGGGSGRPQPGAISRAHHGVLFLDEAPEFARSVLDSLREPLESGFVRVARSGFVAQFPARFQLVMAANPCPCGVFDQRALGCTCTPTQRRRYAQRISGPLLDRIDLVVQTHSVDRFSMLGQGQAGMSSAQVAERVQRAADRMLQRFAENALPFSANATIPGSALRGKGPLAVSLDALKWLRSQPGASSSRGLDKVLRISWTLADLAGVDRPGVVHVQEALSLRDEGGRTAA